MPEIRGLTVSVGQWYADLLAVTLWANMRHLTSCLVVTRPGDPSIEVARKVPGVSVYETEDFHAGGARFNKGICIEKAFDVIGRRGWLAIFDADIAWPATIPLHRLRPGCLHGMRRRILDDPADWRPGLDWSKLPLNHDGSPIGYTQIFDAAAPCLPRIDPTAAERDFWYDPTFAHGGGGDAAFLALWPKDKRVMLNDCEVLHLGPTDVNWFGCDQAGRDLMAKFVRLNGWTRAAAKHPEAAAARAGDLVERVQVPGYRESTFVLPFVRRAQEREASAGVISPAPPSARPGTAPAR